MLFLPNTLATTIEKTNDHGRESTRLPVRPPSANHLRPVPLVVPTITTSESGYVTVQPVLNKTVSATSSLAPPSPAKSTSDTSVSEYGSIVSAEDLASSSASCSPSRCSDEYGGCRQLDLDSASALEDDLRNARIESPEDENKYFMPADVFEQLITVNSVQVELEKTITTFPPGWSSLRYAEKIVKSAPRLFSILVLLRKGGFICDFLEENLDDTHLPFIRDDITHKGGKFKLRSKLHPDQPIKCMARWRQQRINDFAREQWCMDAIIFKKGDKIPHYKFEKNHVLPFIKDDERTGLVKWGAYSSVWEIAIHPAHQFLHEKSDSPKVRKINESSIILWQSLTTHLFRL
jgi:hypothetical protein